MARSREEVAEIFNALIQEFQVKADKALGENSYGLYIALTWNASVDKEKQDYKSVTAVCKSTDSVSAYSQLLHLNRILSTDPFNVASVLHTAVDNYIQSSLPKPDFTPIDKETISSEDEVN